MTKKSFWAWTLLSCLSFVFAQASRSQSLQPPDPRLVPKPWVLHSRIIHEVIPEYPAVATEHHFQGDVFISVDVDERGKVKNASIIESRDKECPECLSALENAAIEAVKKWEYQPTLVDGKPVPVSSWVAFRFHFDQAPSVEILTRSEESSPNVIFGSIIRMPQNPPPTPVDPGKIRIPRAVGEEHLIHRVDPQYPQMAKIAHIQGNVVLQCMIDQQGNVATVKAISGHPILIQAALDAVKQWKYKPFLINGQAVSIETTVTVTFHM